MNDAATLQARIIDVKLDANPGVPHIEVVQFQDQKWARQVADKVRTPPGQIAQARYIDGQWAVVVSAGDPVPRLMGALLASLVRMVWKKYTPHDLTWPLVGPRATEPLYAERLAARVAFELQLPEHHVVSTQDMQTRDCALRIRPLHVPPESSPDRRDGPS